MKRFYEKGRYFVTEDGYVFDRWIFRVYSATIILSAVLVLISLGGFKTYAYAHCPNDTPGQCVNPAYQLCDFPACDKEYLLPGETIGEKPPSDGQKLWFWSIVLFLFSLVFNHVLQKSQRYTHARNQHNRKKHNRKKSVTKTPGR